ncbi:MAG: hypothetical protein ACI9V8_002139 [Urechidicola sp.]
MAIQQHNDTLRHALNQHDKIHRLFVESAFANHDIKNSKVSKHYCPNLLKKYFLKLTHRPDIWLTHFKPSEEDLIFKEWQQSLPEFNVRHPVRGEVFKL